MERKGKLKEPTPSPPKKAWLKRRICCSPSLFGKRWKGENFRLRKWGMEAGWCREWVEKPAGNLLTTQNDYRGKWAVRKKGKKFPHILRFFRAPCVGCAVLVFDFEHRDSTQNKHKLVVVVLSAQEQFHPFHLQNITNSVF